MLPQSDTDPIQRDIDALTFEINKLVRRRELLIADLHARREENSRLHAEAQHLGHTDETAGQYTTEIEELRKRLDELEGKK